jgi:hypothetical protein
MEQLYKPRSAGRKFLPASLLEMALFQWRQFHHGAFAVPSRHLCGLIMTSLRFDHGVGVVACCGSIMHDVSGVRSWCLYGSIMMPMQFDNEVLNWLWN